MPNIAADDIQPHLKETLFITGAFCIAWSWDLVVYSISHIIWGEDPLTNQLAFADQPGTKNLLVLLAQYFLTCLAAAWMSRRAQRMHKSWSSAAVMAIEFFPSPIFAGKLMSYLSQFDMTGIQQALVNLAATLFAAALAHAVPMYLSGPSESEVGSMSESSETLMHRTGQVVRQTLGFGLGIAWNVLLSNFGPSDDSEMDALHILALISYLMLVLVIAFKVSAMAQPDPGTLWEHHLSMLSFAMAVVCGFTLVGFLNTFLHGGIWGSLASFVILLFLAATMSAMVVAADLDGMMIHPDDQVDTNSWEYRSSRLGPCGRILNILLFIPCTWCCCPWIPLLILLAGMTETLGVKERWFELIAMVAGLASSIEGSGMLTAATDSLAQILGICGSKHCSRHPWAFVLLQTGVAIVTTMVLLPAIAPFASTPAPVVEAIAVYDDVEALPPPTAPVDPATEKDTLLNKNPPSFNPDFESARM
eukprot:Nitzschia sp. Nitz4//scaffold99_size76975//42114//43541//NITZ4_005577-RA/size76975-processed-gene-0.52-mRNA-1//1//CDS//3329560853//479//frame0